MIHVISLCIFLTVLLHPVFLYLFHLIADIDYRVVQKTAVFLATICKTVRPMLLSACLSVLTVLSCL